MSNVKRIAAMLAVFGCMATFAAPKAFSQLLGDLGLKISGDIGVRTEYIVDENPANPYDRVRERARFRLWFDVNPRDKVRASFGLETVGTNPTSGWATISDFRKQPVYVSHAYIQYDVSERLTVSGGILKSDITFWKPVQNVWKSDVNPYGVSASANAKIRGGLDFFLNGGVFGLTEYRDSAIGIDDPMNAIAVVQPGLEFNWNNLKAKGAFSLQQFSLANHDTSGNTWIQQNYSLTLVSPAWEVIYTNLVGSYGPMFAGEYSKNIHENAEDTDATQAYVLQMGFGSERINKWKALQVKAAYRYREMNAMPRGFGQTSAYEGEAGKGWEYFFAFGLHKNLAFNATIYRMTDIDGERPQMVSQFDVIYKF